MIEIANQLKEASAAIQAAHQRPESSEADDIQEKREDGEEVDVLVGLALYFKNLRDKIQAFDSEALFAEGIAMQDIFFGTHH